MANVYFRCIIRLHKKGSFLAERAFFVVFGFIRTANHLAILPVDHSTYFSTEASLADRASPRRFLAMMRPCGSSRKFIGMDCTP
jgi:hypothetical protein